MNNNEQDLQTDAPGGNSINMDARGKRPAFFESAEVDALMTALLETMSQLWATRNHVRTLEQLLVDKGIVTAQDLQQFDLSDTEKEQDQQAMQEFFSDAFRAMGVATQSIDSRQKEVDKFQGYTASEATT